MTSCQDPQCNCEPSPNRRTFLLTTAAAGAALSGVLDPRSSVAGPFVGADFERLVSADKKLDRDWLRSLTARGEPTVYRGQELATIGMPVGGIGAGQLYLGGDGKLWHWDIFNLPQADPFMNTSGPNYAKPPAPASPLEQGFAVRVTVGDTSTVRVLDRRGFEPEQIEFRGQYPMGQVAYRDPALPVTVDLEAFSPFIPLNADDSSLPATLLHFRVKNTSDKPVQVDLFGWLENAVCLASAAQRDGVRENRVVSDERATIVEMTAVDRPNPKAAKTRDDIVVEDFEKPTYEGWRVEGTAFGNGPIKIADVPNYQGIVGGVGERLVNSHATAPGTEVGAKDQATGKLTSSPFPLNRDYLRLLVGGGAHPNRTCVNLRIGDRVVRTATGRNDNRMQPVTWDVREFAGQMAHLEIVDAVAGPWGNIGVDQIVLSDQPGTLEPLNEQPDFGSLALAVLHDGAAGKPFHAVELPLDAGPAQMLFPTTSKSAKANTSAPFPKRLAGAVGRTWTLAPGQEVQTTFILAWYFPRLPRGRFEQLRDFAHLRRAYGERFESAAAVARYVARNFPRLAGDTRTWHRTWYDSTLPYWLLDRAMQPLCCVATATCYRFTGNRFYAYEGTYCCDGTCSHVWHYAQALARIFPELERSLREQVDYGLSFHADSGAIDYRGEYGRHVAVNGQAGTIVRVYREHQMSADSAFLRRIWPRVRRSIENLLERDPNGDGILDGEQYNTLDASWFGEISWISSLYLVALRAGAAMATEMEDAAFAARCTAIAERGAKSMVERLFNGEYFIHKLDPRNTAAVNTNDGCHIDQLLGQSWAWQVGLPRVVPAGESKKALQSLWKYNFTPDIGPYRQQFQEIAGGRWYAMPGEGGLLMCTWPKGGAEKARGDGKSPFIGYFNECMTGFEYQVAGHMVQEGLVEEGLAVARMVHDRYHASRRNPFNDVECSDHYARAMSSYGIFLAACGYTYHGPRGAIGFAPRVAANDFRAPFTAAEGWGTFAQQAKDGNVDITLSIAWGKLRLRTLTLEHAAGDRPLAVTVKVGDQPLELKVERDGARLSLQFGKEVTIAAGQKLEVQTIEKTLLL